MITCVKVSVFVICALLSIAPPAEGQTDCVLKKQKEDLKVYTCSSDESKLKVLKSEFVLEDVSFGELITFMNNIENYVNWQYNTSEAEILETREHSKIYRAVVDAPWPASNREMIVEISFQFDSVKQALTISSHSVDYEYPIDESLVRVPISASTWYVTPMKNSLKVEYNLRIDPGGSVPTWLINMAMADGPYQSFTKVKEELARKSR